MSMVSHVKTMHWYTNKHSSNTCLCQTSLKWLKKHKACMNAAFTAFAVICSAHWWLQNAQGRGVPGNQETMAATPLLDIRVAPVTRTRGEGGQSYNNYYMTLHACLQKYYCNWNFVALTIFAVLKFCGHRRAVEDFWGCWQLRYLVFFANCV